MATCRDCFHWEACKAMFEVSGGLIVADDFKGSSVRCKSFVSTADVAPRAEVELWKGRTEAVFAAIPETRREFARKIFEEIEKLTFVSGFGGDVPNLVIMTEKDFAELKKKYSEAETEPPRRWGEMHTVLR